MTEQIIQNGKYKPLTTEMLEELITSIFFKSDNPVSYIQVYLNENKLKDYSDNEFINLFNNLNHSTSSIITNDKGYLIWLTRCRELNLIQELI
jgi:hypothetical protein